MSDAQLLAMTEEMLAAVHQRDALQSENAALRAALRTYVEALVRLSTRAKELEDRARALLGEK
jgi:hypothetical protein